VGGGRIRLLDCDFERRRIKPRKNLKGKTNLKSWLDWLYDSGVLEVDVEFRWNMDGFHAHSSDPAPSNAAESLCVYHLCFFCVRVWSLAICPLI